MLRALYDWTLSLAARKTAVAWLAVIAFIESSIFLIPADVLYLPMALARPERAYRYAIVATVASTLGGIAGYFLGSFAYDALARPILDFYGKLGEFEQLRRCTGEDTIMLLLVTSGLAHLPPIKVVTILAGVVQISFGFFVLSCIIARGARFMALACESKLEAACDELAGTVAEAQKWHGKLFPLCRDLLSLATNPIPIKAAMQRLGRDTGDVRLPLTELPEGDRAKLEKTLKAYGLV